MEINEKKLKDERIRLSREIEKLQAQQQQAQMMIQAIPKQIASRHGNIARIDAILSEENLNKSKNKKN